MMARKVMGALVGGAMGAGALGAVPAFADTFTSSIVEQLESQGFKSISRERTWLGRTRIVAESEQGQREIIVNPNNGEILRDLWLAERRSESGNGGTDSGSNAGSASASGTGDAAGGGAGSSSGSGAGGGAASAATSGRDDAGDDGVDRSEDRDEESDSGTKRGSGGMDDDSDD